MLQGRQALAFPKNETLEISQFHVSGVVLLRPQKRGFGILRGRNFAQTASLFILAYCFSTYAHEPSDFLRDVNVSARVSRQLLAMTSKITMNR